MKDSLRPGLTHAESRHIDRERTISFMGEALRIYGTPEMLRDIEHTCRNLIAAHCDPGEDSVGIGAAFDHTAATPLGMDVRIEVTVTAVNGRRVELAVTARDAIEPICTGTHSRFVVDVARAKQRLDDKIARWRGR